MRKLFLTLSLLAVSAVLYKCTQVEYVETPRIEPVFSEQARQIGELYAETLTATAKEMKKQKVKLTDKGSIFRISQNVIWDH